MTTSEKFDVGPDEEAKPVALKRSHTLLNIRHIQKAEIFVIRLALLIILIITLVKIILNELR